MTRKDGVVRRARSGLSMAVCGFAVALTHTCEEAGDRQHAAQWYRTVIGISRQHPETWNYYAYQAQGGPQVHGQSQTAPLGRKEASRREHAGPHHIRAP